MPRKNSSLLDTTAFTTMLAKATRKAGHRVERTEELALFVDMHGTSLRCNLATVYNAYRQSPDRLDDIVAAHLAALAKVPAVPMPSSAAVLHSRLLPMLMQRSRLTALHDYQHRAGRLHRLSHSAA